MPTEQRSLHLSLTNLSPKMSFNRILITGATGYVGGTLINRLVASSDPTIQSLTFDLLVRTPDAAEKLRSTYGKRITTILWSGLLDTSFIISTASQYDLIINVGSGFIPSGAEAFVTGLAERKSSRHRHPGGSGSGAPAPAPWLLNISGCTNLADKPLTGVAEPDRVWEDAKSHEVYAWEVAREAESPYPQRTTEVAVLTAGEKTGVNVVSLNTPVIFGEGEGLFKLTPPVLAPPLFWNILYHSQHHETVHNLFIFDCQRL